MKPWKLHRGGRSSTGSRPVAVSLMVGVVLAVAALNAMTKTEMTSIATVSTTMNIEASKGSEMPIHARQLSSPSSHSLITTPRTKLG
jgi:hypothetical protein